MILVRPWPHRQDPTMASPQPTMGLEPKQLEGRLRGIVPAVQHAIDILSYLRSQGGVPAPMMEVARGLGMNPSTCYNILKTLQQAGWVAYDPMSKRYELGTGLVELSTAVNRRDQTLRVALDHVQGLCRAIGLTCVVGEMRQGAGFVVVGKVEGIKRVRVTVSVGERFQPNAAVFAKAYYAWCPETQYDEMVAQHGLPQRSPRSVTDRESFRRDIAAVRLRGYSISVGEYFPEYNAVGSAVIDSSDRVKHVLVITGFGSQISPRLLPAIGRRLHLTAREITREIGGSYPSDWTNLTGWRDT
jgi:DNA-binding IclR family transcriptional regulator